MRAIVIKLHHMWIMKWSRQRLLQMTKAQIPFSFTKREPAAMKPVQLLPSDLAAVARDGGVKQVTTSSWETFTQVIAAVPITHSQSLHADATWRAGDVGRRQ
jgi:hypothetical protein